MSDVIEIVVAALLLGLFVGCLLALPVMFLWNSLMPYIFGLPVIGFWQALGLTILTHFLFSPSSSSSK